MQLRKVKGVCSEANSSSLLCKHTEIEDSAQESYFAKCCCTMTNILSTSLHFIFTPERSLAKHELTHKVCSVSHK